MRVRALFTTTLTAALLATCTATAVAAPAAATPAGTTPVPAQAGDVLAISAVTTPTAASRPEGSRVLRGTQVTASSSGARDVRIVAHRTTAGQRTSMRITAPLGGRFRAGENADVARTPDAGHAGVTVTWDGVTCTAGSGSVQVVQVAYGADRHVTAFAASFVVYCGATRFDGSVKVGLDAPRLTVNTFATSPNVTALGRVPVGATRRVTVEFTYYGAHAAGEDSPFTGPGAGDATLVDNGCSGPGFDDGAQCLVIVDVTPRTTGSRAFSFGFGDRGGRFAVAYKAVAAGA